ncbi:cupredoxin domain-containing protein [Polycyclovorans algicola]|uniref:cupredoxin domain-containing protein n=1 Tax=Polycyclovorans algicola TaxID=616992 RepID=UPI000693D831|nr:plastocyanin/azurin family copper-binding protein [Polycyclovorans algicola]
MTTSHKTRFHHAAFLPALTLSAFLVGVGGTAIADTTPSAPLEISGKQASIEIVDFMQFTPEELTVEAGTTVVFTNLDGSNHKITVDGAHSGRMSMNKQWAHTFDTAGTFPYACTMHPRMKGTITVQ